MRAMHQASEVLRPVPVKLERDGRTALVIVDMQVNGTAADEGFDLALDRLQPGVADKYHTRIESKVLPTIGALLDYFRSHELPVVYLVSGSVHRDYRDLPARTRTWIQGLEGRSGVGGLMWAEDPSFRIREEIAPQTGEMVIRKLSFSPFNGTDLHDRLQSLGVENLVLTGVATCLCVESTARDAVDHGYGCVMVEEGQADYDHEAHQAALRAFAMNIGSVTPTANQLIAAFEQGVEV